MLKQLVSCLYIPDFSAWAFLYALNEEAPIAVVSSGRVIASTIDAKRAGVEPGITTERARLLVNNIHIRQRDAALEQAVWEDVICQLNALTPFMEPAVPVAYFGADEAGSGRLATHLGAHLGIAPNRSYALFAALSAGPGRSVKVEPRQVASFLKSVPVRRLGGLGFSEDTTRHFEFFGLRTLGAVYRLRPKHLTDQFGEEGAKLYALLHPDETLDLALFYPLPVVTESYEFDDPATEPFQLIPALEETAGRAVAELGSLVCRRVRVSLVPHGHTDPVFACRVMPAPTASLGRILTIGKTLLSNLLQPGLEVDSIKLELGALANPKHPQGTLFNPVAPQLAEALENILRKYPRSLLRFVTDAEAVFHEDEQRAETLSLEDVTGKVKPPKRRAL